MDSSNTETFVGSDRQGSDQLAGSVLVERYLIERAMGHGGVGAVYLARDRKLLDKPVVMARQLFGKT